MASTSLAERQARLEQQRARLQRDETKIRDDARKARTRRLIETGGLVDKARLGDIEANVLYGALLAVAATMSNPEQVARWEAEGGRAFDREAKAREAHKEPLILLLHGAQPALAAARLRGLGFRWSKVLRHWEGLAVFDDAKAAADDLGGTLQRMAPPPSQSESASESERDTAATTGERIDATGGRISQGSGAAADHPAGASAVLSARSASSDGAA